MTDQPTTGYIGPSLNLRGHLSGQGTLHIDGQLEGQLSTQGSLVVGARGRVIGPVDTGVLQVEGQISGNVMASEAVEILPGGRITGDVRSPEVAVADGAVLHGSILMDMDLEGLEADLFGAPSEDS